MGRQLRRVPLDFEWPLSMTWKGYVNPYRGMKCSPCDGTGQSPEVKQLSDDWYGRGGDPTARWCDRITQDEVDALVAAGRLRDLTSVFVPGEGWKLDPEKPHPTADLVNALNRNRSILSGHDAINQWICVETRAKRLGVWGEDGACRWCRGHGDIFPDESFRQLRDEWEYIEPPTGDGWQLWETVSEGSPISPVFPTPEELARWLVANPWNRCDAGTTYEQWLTWMNGPGWAPSMIADGRRMRSGVEALADMATENDTAIPRSNS